MTLLLVVVGTACGQDRPARPGPAAASAGLDATAAAPAGARSAAVLPSANGSTKSPAMAPTDEPLPAPSASPAALARTYPWVEDVGITTGTALALRLPPPAGFERVRLDREGFGAWLRELPLAPPGTPVRNYLGGVAYSAEDPRILAVSTLDLSAADLQQCADSVIRLHAEWRWSRGRRDHRYRAAAGTELTYARFVAGDRIVADGPRLSWRPGPARSDDHRTFRAYLDQVFAWANTGSLARDARAVAPDDVRPGDFFVLPGNPGHTVLLLDLARSPDGRLRALIGQSYMPAQGFYVLRGPDEGWFPLEAPSPVDTPFWRPFPWSALHRLD